METPQSLSPRSPSNDLEPLDNTSNATSNPIMSATSPPSHNPSGISISSRLASSNSVKPPQQQRGIIGSGSSNINQHTNNNNNNNNNVINMISSPVSHSIPVPVPVAIPNPTPLCISHSPSPATPIEVVMITSADSTQSLNSEPLSTRRPPSVPPRKCRTRSPTPNTSKGKL